MPKPSYLKTTHTFTFSFGSLPNWEFTVTDLIYFSMKFSISAAGWVNALFIIQLSCGNPETIVFMKTSPCNRRWPGIHQSFHVLVAAALLSACRCLFYLWPKICADSWQPPCHNPLRRRHEGWWSWTALVAEQSHGAHWRQESLWKCPVEATDKTLISQPMKTLTWGHSH